MCKPHVHHLVLSSRGGGSTMHQCALVCLLLLTLFQTSSAGLLKGYIINPTYADIEHAAPAKPSADVQAWTGLDCSTAAKKDTTGLCAAQQLQQGTTGAEALPDMRSAPTAPTAAASRAAPANPLRLQKPYLVCVSAWVPMVHCSPDMDPSEYKGYQVELFRMLAKEVGWAETDYSFTCMDHSAMMADLNDPAGNCTVSASGAEVSPENVDAGLKFSWPTYKSGLRVMISAHLQTGSTWAFADIFSAEVWLLLAGTTIGVGLLVGLMEWANETYKKAGEWQSWEWYSLCKIAHVTPHVGDPGADASRVVILGYGFLVLVMMSMYTARAASQLTAAALVHPVHSEHDLADKSPYKTQTWNEYVSKLASHQHIKAYGKPWDNAQDLDKMVASLRDGSYTALILDSPVLEYITGQNEACDLFLVGDTFETFSVALAFPPATNSSLVYDFSLSIVKLQTYQGAMDMLESVYIKTGGASKCFGSDSGSHGSGVTIELTQVSGLWYILLITTGVCFVLTVVHNLTKGNKMDTLKRLGTLKWSVAGGGGGSMPGYGSMPGDVSMAGHDYQGSMPGHSSSSTGGWRSFWHASSPPKSSAAATPKAAAVAVPGVAAGANGGSTPPLASPMTPTTARRQGSMDVGAVWGPVASSPAFAKMLAERPAVNTVREQAVNPVREEAQHPLGAPVSDDGAFGSVR